jgi:hypothetical protein
MIKLKANKISMKGTRTKVRNQNRVEIPTT